MSLTPLYIIMAILFVLYIIFQKIFVLSILFGISLFFIIILTIAIEIRRGVSEEGVKKSIIEIVIAIVAVIIFWFVLKFALNTQYPLNVVPTCSMLPILHRGDLVVIKGVVNASKLNAPIVNVSKASWNTMIRNFSNEFLVCVAYNPKNGKVSGIFKPGDILELYRPGIRSGNLIPENAQGQNFIKYKCGTAQVALSNGNTIYEAYTKSISIGNTSIQGDNNNSIVVYKTLPSDYFYQLGDSYIVHRVYAILHVGNNYYVLTKGDNNPGLDIQFGNYPILLGQNKSFIEGRVILIIPYIGYLRLAFSRQISEPRGCNSTILH